MVDELIRLIALHENNALIFYSPLLTDQIPESFAANAFNVVQESVHRYEIVRLCTFWDGLDLEKSNVPTVIELVDDLLVVNQVVKETKDAWGRIGTSLLNPDPDPAVQANIEAALRAHEEDCSKKQAAEAGARLRQAISAARSTIGSPKLTSVMNLRNKSLAHRLAETREEKRGTVAPMKRKPPVKTAVTQLWIC